MTLILRNEEAAELLTIDEVRAAVREGFLEQAVGAVQLPPRTTTDSTSGHGWLRLMPAILNRSKLMGFKAMHSTPGVGVRYVVMLYALDSGELLALIDADGLTSRRTAATAAVGLDALCAPDASELGVLGSSEQARAMLTATAHLRPFQRIKVFSPNPTNRARFAEQMSTILRRDVRPVDTAAEVFHNSQAVISAFRAGAQPAIIGDWIEPGTHLHAASAVRPEARELADDVWRRCDVVVVDDLVHAFESGDGVSALANHAIDLKRVDGIWQILDGSRPGRHGDGVSLFKAVGTGLQDLALAAAIYRRACEAKVGTEIGDFPKARK